MNRNEMLKRITKSIHKREELSTEYKRLINDVRDIEHDTEILFDSLIPGEKKLFKLQKKLIDQEVFYESAKLALKDLLLSVKIKQTNFGAFSNSKTAINQLLEQENEILDDIEEYNRDIRSMTYEFNEKNHIKQNALKLLKFRAEYFIEDSYTISAELLKNEIDYSEQKLSDLIEKNKELVKEIQEISNTYAIKVSPAFLKRVRAIKESKYQISIS